jgi:hypothetical protein
MLSVNPPDNMEDSHTTAAAAVINDGRSRRDQNHETAAPAPTTAPAAPAQAAILITHS